MHFRHIGIYEKNHKNCCILIDQFIELARSFRVISFFGCSCMHVDSLFSWSVSSIIHDDCMFLQFTWNLKSTCRFWLIGSSSSTASHPSAWRLRRAIDAFPEKNFSFNINVWWNFNTVLLSVVINNCTSEEYLSECSLKYNKLCYLTLD